MPLWQTKGCRAIGLIRHRFGKIDAIGLESIMDDGEKSRTKVKSRGNRGMDGE